MTGADPAAGRRVVVLTGATGCFGHAVALQLAQVGWHIVALARHPKKLEQLDDAIIVAGGSATLVPFDLAGDLAALESLGLQLGHRFGRIDAVIMAATQLGPLTPLAQLEMPVLQRLLQVNAVAHQALLRACAPWLRQAPRATVAFIDCNLGADTPAYWGGYRAGKAALRALADSYAAETHNTNVQVLQFDPGALRGGIHAEAFPGLAPEALPDPALAAARLIALLQA